MDNKTTKLPKWFWVVSIIFLLWNLMGVFNYLNQAYNSVQMLEGMTPEQIATFESIPAWATGAFAIAVFIGTIASIGLLTRKKWALPFFWISLIAAVAQFMNWLFISNAVEVFGPTTYIMPIIVMLIGLYEVLFSKKGIKKSWLK